MRSTSNGGCRAIVLCPMKIEHAAVARAVREAGLRGVRVVQTGVGKGAVVRAVQGVLADGSGGAERGGRGSPVPANTSPSPLGGETGAPEVAGLVVLAGACGGLRECGDVPRIGRVIDEHGREWRVGEGEGVTLIGVDRVISTPREKRELADRTGAAIVDMESHAFIAECERLGLPWHIVRGVSDTPEETLPDAVLGWIDGAGNTRYGRAAIDMVRRPRLIGPIAAVMRRSGRVLPEVGAEVVRVVRRATD